MTKNKKKDKKQGKKQKKQPKKQEKKAEKPKKLSGLEKFKDFYFHEYKKLFIIPVLLFLFSAIVLFSSYSQTGEFIKRDVSLKGGISLTVNTDYSDISDLEKYLFAEFPDASLNIRTIESGGAVTGIIIEASDIDEELLVEKVNEKIPLTKDNYSLESMGSTLGESFFKQMFIALLLAFASMGLVFQYYFKSWYATFAALFSAFMDIFITLGIMDLLGLKLTAGGIAAYLMLIGYSIDTSILISTKLLKEQTADLKKSIFDAMRTGLTMSAAGIAAMGISFFLTNNTTLKQIMLILVVGLIMDIFMTWIANVAFLRFNLEKKK
jgi:preprotein translocase subunit SecF